MTKKSNSNLHLIAAFFVVILLNSCTQNWPQFRGPNQNMVVSNKNLPAVWDDVSNIDWTYNLKGISWSSPIIWGNKIFITTDYVVKENESTGEENLGALDDIYRWELTCLDLKTGKELWKQTAYEGTPRIKTHAGNSYASETPVSDGKRVYVYFGMMGAYCFDMDGNPLWKKDLGAFATLRDWGTGSSPVVFNEHLYIQVDNEDHSFIVALDAKTGNEIWKTNRIEKTNYSTPFIWKNKMRTELITLGDSARSYNLETGEVYWSLKLGGERSICSPVANSELLFIGNSGRRRAPGSLFAVKKGANGNITPNEGQHSNSAIAWFLNDAGTGNPSPLLHNELIYLISSRGGDVVCVEASSGKIVYKNKLDDVGACWSSPWANNKLIHITDERGMTHIFKAGRTFEALKGNKLNDKIWASPAISKNAYVIKGAEKLYCIKSKK